MPTEIQRVKVFTGRVGNQFGSGEAAAVLPDILA